MLWFNEREREMEYRKEKDFQQKASFDTFDEIYTNIDISVNENYDASQGYPFDYPIRWLRDASMNKRIAIRRLICTPTSHIITLRLFSLLDSSSSPILISERIEITQADNLVKVLSGMRLKFSKEDEEAEKLYSLWYDYDTSTNGLCMSFIDNNDFAYRYYFEDPDECTNDNGEKCYPNIDELLKFLNQPLTKENRLKLTTNTMFKEFDNVWNRDSVFFHASFSTSKRKYIGINGDFYMTPTLLYPPPSNESTFYIRFTSDGTKNILIRHCAFMVQLCYIVNFMKTKIL